MPKHELPKEPPNASNSISAHFSLFCLKKCIWVSILQQYNSIIARPFASRGKFKPIETYVKQYNYRPHFASVIDFLTAVIINFNI